MTIETQQKTTCSSTKINRIMYGLFVAMSMYFLIANKDYGTAMSNLGIALIFDPFDSKVLWTNRPIWQRAWLIVHVVIVFTLLAIYLMK